MVDLVLFSQSQPCGTPGLSAHQALFTPGSELELSQANPCFQVYRFPEDLQSTLRKCDGIGFHFGIAREGERQEFFIIKMFVVLCCYCSAFKLV